MRNKINYFILRLKKTPLVLLFRKYLDLTDNFIYYYCTWFVTIIVIILSCFTVLLIYESIVVIYNLIDLFFTLLLYPTYYDVCLYSFILFCVFVILPFLLYRPIVFIYDYLFFVYDRNDYVFKNTILSNYFFFILIYNLILLFIFILFWLALYFKTLETLILFSDLNFFYIQFSNIPWTFRGILNIVSSYLLFFNTKKLISLLIFTLLFLLRILRLHSQLECKSNNTNKYSDSSRSSKSNTTNSITLFLLRRLLSLFSLKFPILFFFSESFFTLRMIPVSKLIDVGFEEGSVEEKNNVSEPKSENTTYLNLQITYDLTDKEKNALAEVRKKAVETNSLQVTQTDKESPIFLTACGKSNSGAEVLKKFGSIVENHPNQKDKIENPSWITNHSLKRSSDLDEYKVKEGTHECIHFKVSTNPINNNRRKI